MDTNLAASTPSVPLREIACHARLDLLLEPVLGHASR